MLIDTVEQNLYLYGAIGGLIEGDIGDHCPIHAGAGEVEVEIKSRRHPHTLNALLIALDLFSHHFRCWLRFFPYNHLPYCGAGGKQGNQHQ